MNLAQFHQRSSSGAGPSPPPPPPSRDSLCRVVCSLQGLVVDGTNWWDPYLTDPLQRWHQDKDARLRFYQQTRAAGNTHVSLSLEGVYGQPQQGLDSLMSMLPIMREAIDEGGLTGLLLNCKGDGNGNPNEQNFDPGSLGWYWLMNNFDEIVKRVEDAGLFPFTIFSPGFDGVVPGWQPWSRVDEFALMARDVVGPDGYLALELSSGYCNWSGETPVNWHTDAGKCFDVILQEFAIDMGPPDPPPTHLLLPDGSDWKPSASAEDRAPWDMEWQMVGRMVHPYLRPANQPPLDDPHPPFLLGENTPRGPYYYIAYEYDTYSWIRGSGYPLAKVEAHRQALRDMGCTIVC